MNKLINTLNYYRYYLKYYGKFIFLHKPLCEKFQKDSFFIMNKFYFCRSCLFLYIGLLLSVLFLFYIKTINLNYFMLYSCFVVIISYPKFYKKYSRYFRDFIRLNNGLMCGGLLVITYKYNPIYSLISLIFLFLIKHCYNKIRNKIDICEDCEELLKKQTCSGYILQKNALLDLEENYCKTLEIKERDLL